MNKRAFTLIEMIVVLVFISIIALMALPNITTMLKNSVDDEYKIFLDDVFLATEAYIEKYRDDYPSLNEDGAVTEIYMKDLVDEKLISTNLVNPKYCIDSECTSKKIATCTDTSCTVDDYTIKVTKDEIGKYKYELLIGINTCEYAVNQVVFDEGYSGSVKTFTPKCDGTYKLEVWGAQGGSANSTLLGGYGGYSKGNISLMSKTNLYVVVGGKAEDNATAGNTSTGGYNGGNSSTEKINYDFISNGGGGATHIALDDGLLKDLSSHKDDNRILIVAGGGGGAFDYTKSTSYDTAGGSGGGNTGGNPVNTNTYSGHGATQIEGGTSCTYSNYVHGSFGLGGTAYRYSGGGGGYYGGGAGMGAGGGSGYIANSLLTDKKMVCYNCTTSNEVATKTESNTCHNSTATADCSKEGNGHAKITYLGS